MTIEELKNLKEAFDQRVTEISSRRLDELFHEADNATDGISCERMSVNGKTYALALCVVPKTDAQRELVKRDATRLGYLWHQERKEFANASVSFLFNQPAVTSNTVVVCICNPLTLLYASVNLDQIRGLEQKLRALNNFE